jgi:hypothetical protein
MDMAAWDMAVLDTSFPDMSRRPGGRSGRAPAGRQPVLTPCSRNAAFNERLRSCDSCR